MTRKLATDMLAVTWDFTATGTSSSVLGSAPTVDPVFTLTS